MKARLAGLLTPCLLVGLAIVLVVPAAAGRASSASNARIPSGKVLFIAACGSCHSFAPAGTRGTKGPNLVDEAQGYGDVISQIDEGGDGMPALGSSLTRAEVRAIATFVAKASSSSGGGGDE